MGRTSVLRFDVMLWPSSAVRPGARPERGWNVSPTIRQRRDEGTRVDAARTFCRRARRAILDRASTKLRRQEATTATMRVAQIPKASGPLELVERPIPDPGPGSLFTKIDHCRGVTDHCAS